MSIRELGGHYLSVEDRAVIRLVDGESQEYRLLFTRRILLGASAILERMVDFGLSKTEGQGISPVSQALADFRKEAIQQATTFTDQTQGGTRFPMGQDPILVVGFRVGHEALEDVLLFELLNTQHLTMRVPTPISYQFFLLLKRTIATAAWLEPLPPGLILPAGEAQESTLSVPETRPPTNITSH